MRQHLLRKTQKLTGVPWTIVEKDYLLSWLLAGIAQIEDTPLIFKGGTALKKCYFKDDYRFSEDLDFTSTAKSLSSHEEIIHRAVKYTERLLNQNEPCKLSCERYQEKRPHPNGQEAYIVRAQFIWQREPLTRVYIEITKEEPIWFPSVTLPIFHEYNEPFMAAIQTYALEEIVSEKLRGILQHTKKLHERQWTRSRARDYYDLWQIMRHYPDKLSLNDLQSALLSKCAAKDVSFDSAASFFDTKMTKYIEETWEQWLGDLMPNLPQSVTVLEDLREQLERLFENSILPI